MTPIPNRQLKREWAALDGQKPAGKAWHETRCATRVRAGCDKRTAADPMEWHWFSLVVVCVTRTVCLGLPLTRQGSPLVIV